MPRTPKISSQAVTAIGKSPAASPSSATGSLIATSTSMRQLSRSLSVAIARRHSVPSWCAGGVSGGMCASSSRLAWRRSSSARRAQPATANEHDRQADPDRAERGAEHEQRGGQRADEAERQAESTRYSSASTGAPQAAAEVDRVARRCHGPLPTRTSPVVESAWTWNGASSPVVTPRTLRLPSSLSASTR